MSQMTDKSNFANMIYGGPYCYDLNVC
jgi:hypothetical protein